VLAVMLNLHHLIGWNQHILSRSKRLAGAAGRIPPPAGVKGAFTSFTTASRRWRRLAS